jgi:hypothetical protein
MLSPASATGDRLARHAFVRCLECNRVEISGRGGTRATQIIDAYDVLDRLMGPKGPTASIRTRYVF